MKIDRGSSNMLGALAMAVAVLGGASAVSAHTDLRVVNFGGAQARSHMLALVRPYEELTGKVIEMDEYNGGIEEIRRQVDAANVKWDAVDMEYSDLIRACEEGLLEKIDHGFLLPGADGTPAAQDFVEGALTDCGVGSVIWATVYAYKRGVFKGTTSVPSRIGDFFDVAKFPGKRGLRKDPRGNLEWALMSDGVAADKVYQTLSTPAGVDRAFAILDKLKPHIVWWTRGAEPAQLLESGEVAMTAAWNGRLYRPIVEKFLPIEIIWDGQLWEIEFWGIPKGSRNRERAIDFLKFATQTQQLADQAKYIPYGPVRKSSRPIVDSTVASHLPTYAGNLSNALRFDSKWWAENLDAIRGRFDKWAKPALGEVQQRGARF